MNPIAVYVGSLFVALVAAIPAGYVLLNYGLLAALAVVAVEVAVLLAAEKRYDRRSRF